MTARFHPSEFLEIKLNIIASGLLCFYQYVAGKDAVLTNDRGKINYAPLIVGFRGEKLRPFPLLKSFVY